MNSTTTRPAVTVTVTRPGSGASEARTFLNHAEADTYAAANELTGCDVSMRVHDHRLVSTPDGNLITIPRIPSGAVALTASAMARHGALCPADIKTWTSGEYFDAHIHDERARIARVMNAAAVGLDVVDLEDYDDDAAEAVSVAAIETI